MPKVRTPAINIYYFKDAEEPETLFFGIFLVTSFTLSPDFKVLKAFKPK